MSDAEKPSEEPATPVSTEQGPPSRLTRSRASDSAARPGFRDPANTKSKAMKKKRGKKKRR